MTGHPLLRVFILLAALGLMAGAIGRLTADRPVEKVSSEPVVAVPENTTVLALFDSPVRPIQIAISKSGNLIAEIRPSGSEELAIPIQIQESGSPVDLVIEAKWPPSDPPVENALRVRIESPDATVVDNTFWGDPDVQDVLTIPRGQAP